MKKYTCPCCGYKTLDNKPPRTYDICPICFWEDDGVQYDDPDYKGGANDRCLREAQRNFQTIGASDEGLLKFVRKPNQVEVKDIEWKLKRFSKMPPLIRGWTLLGRLNNMFSDVEIKLKKRNKLLFSRDSQCLQELIKLIQLQDHRTLVMSRHIFKVAM